MAKPSIAFDDYIDPPRQDFEPRPNASQIYGAKRRETTEQPATRQPFIADRQFAITAAAGLVVVALIVMATIQLSGQPRPLQVTPEPTEAQARAFLAAPTRPPAPPTATIRPTTPPATAALVAAPVAPPQTGRGLGVVESVPVVEAQPTYIEVVAEQAPHCVRGCDGQPGPSGGDWVAVPTIVPAQAEVILKQAPHKVR